MLYVCIHIDLYSYACVYVCNRWLQWFIVAIIVCSHRLSPSTLRAERKTSQKLLMCMKEPSASGSGQCEVTETDGILPQNNCKLKQMSNKCYLNPYGNM